MEVHDGSDVYKAGIQMFMMDDANMESSISRVHKRQGLFPEFKPVSRPFSFYFLDRTCKWTETHVLLDQNANSGLWEQFGVWFYQDTNYRNVCL